ncbi:MAG: SRPBCC domain-containing protein [Chromatiales bacterium]|nr:SRPBCC domain-containing protein [Chromatiales bacterium]
MATGTVRLHRVLRAPPERVYRAFLNAEAMAKWLPPNGFTGQGAPHGRQGRRHVSGCPSRTSPRQQSHAFGGEYLELVPNERIRYTDKFDDPNLPGVMKTTVSLTGGILSEPI